MIKLPPIRLKAGNVLAKLVELVCGQDHPVEEGAHEDEVLGGTEEGEEVEEEARHGFLSPDT